ncbi:hypothetical protein ASH01_14350 [Terrabacter sp. Soil811]|nr:hypothetical protein ASH01_14350 [Terrabacter sp. Soil811]
MTSDDTTPTDVICATPGTVTDTPTPHGLDGGGDGDTHAQLYVCEDFAQLLEAITVARSQWDADTGATERSSSATAPDNGASPGMPLATWTPVNAAS